MIMDDIFTGKTPFHKTDFARSKRGFYSWVRNGGDASAQIAQRFYIAFSGRLS